MAEEVRGPHEIQPCSHINRRARFFSGEPNDQKRSFSANPVLIKNLAHQSGGHSLVKRIVAIAIANLAISALKPAPFFGRGRAQTSRPSARARHVPSASAFALELAVPNAATIARGPPLLVRMLKLQVTGRHVEVGPNVLGCVLNFCVDIVFVDDHETEGFEKLAFQSFVHRLRMIRGEKPHFFGEREVEKRDFTT